MIRYYNLQETPSCPLMSSHLCESRENSLTAVCSGSGKLVVLIKPQCEGVIQNGGSPEDHWVFYPK